MALFVQAGQVGANWAFHYLIGNNFILFKPTKWEHNLAPFLYNQAKVDISPPRA